MCDAMTPPQYSIKDIDDTSDYLIAGKVLSDIATYAYGNWVQKVISRPAPTSAQQQAPDLSHIHPDRHGCMTCLEPDCPVWQAADQNCWKSLAEHDAAIAAAARNEVLDTILKSPSDTIQATEEDGDLHAWNIKTIESLRQKIGERK